MRDARDIKLVNPDDGLELIIICDLKYVTLILTMYKDERRPAAT